MPRTATKVKLPTKMPRVPANARPRHLHRLTMHERQVLIMYVSATPQIRQQIDAALWETHRTVDTHDAAIGAMGRFQDHSTVAAWFPFMAAHRALHGNGGPE